MAITVDDREVTQHPDIPTLLKTPVIVTRLDSADYAFLDRNNDPVGIERCEIGNLMQKIRNGELESQLTRCAESYSTVILLTEGVYDGMDGLVAHYHKTRTGTAYYRSRIEPFFKMAEVNGVLMRLAELGIENVATPNFDCSMGIIDTIFKQRTKPEEAHTMFKKLRHFSVPSKISNNPAVPMLLALCPRMPEKVAVRLIYKYDTIWDILQASIADLKAVEGMGATLIDRLHKGVGKHE
jgi:ERCC4-type nuclease